MPDPTPRNYPLGDLSGDVRRAVKAKQLEEIKRRKAEEKVVIAPQADAWQEEVETEESIEAYSKSMGNVLKKYSLPNSKEGQVQVFSNLWNQSLHPEEGVSGYDADEFRLVNSYAQRFLKRTYESPEEAATRFGEDKLLHEQELLKLRNTVAQSDEKHTLTATSNGQILGSVDRADESTNKDFASRLPKSMEQFLYKLGAIDVFKRATEGMREIPVDDASLEKKIPDPRARKKFRENVMLSRIPARAKDIFVPLYQHPVGGRNVVLLPQLELGLYTFYQRREEKRLGKFFVDLPAKEKLEKEAEIVALVRKDVSQVTADPHVFAYHEDPVQMRKDFIEGRGFLGSLGTNRLLRPLVAVFVNPRKGGDVIRSGDETIEHMGEIGGWAELLSDTSFTRVMDYYQRLAPTEAVGAAFTLAHEDYIDEFGGEVQADGTIVGGTAKGRGAWVARRGAELWGSDRHALRIMRTFDSGGHLLTRAGSVMADEYGDKYPFIFNVLGGTAIFAIMLIEPSPAMALHGIGVVGIKAIHSWKGLKNSLYGPQAYLPASGKILDAVLEGVDETDPFAVREAIDVARKIAKKDLGTPDGVDYLMYMAERGVDALLPVANIGGNALRSTMRNYTQKAVGARRLYDEVLQKSSMKAHKGRLQHPPEGAQLAADTQDVLNLADAETKTRVAAYQASEALFEFRVQQLTSAKLLESMTRTQAKITNMKQVREFLRLLESSELKAVLKKKGLAYPGGLRARLKAASNEDILDINAEVAAFVRKFGARNLDTMVVRLTDSVFVMGKQLDDLRADDMDYLNRLTQGLDQAVRPIEKVIGASYGIETGDTLRQQVNSLETTMAALAKLAGEAHTGPAMADKMGPLLEETLSATSKAFVDQLKANNSAVQVMTTREGKEFFAEVSRTSAKGLTALEEAKSAPAFRSRVESFGDIDALSDEQFLRAAKAAHLGPILWNAPARVHVRFKQSKAAALAKQPWFWMAKLETEVAKLFVEFPVFTRTPRLIKAQVTEELQTVAKETSRNVTLWGYGIDQVMDMADVSDRLRTVRELLGTVDLIRLPSTTLKLPPVPGKVPVVGGYVARGRRDITIHPRGSGNRPIIRLAWEAIRERAEGAKRGVDIKGDFFLTSFVKSRISDISSQRAKQEIHIIQDKFLQEVHAQRDVLDLLPDYAPKGGDLTTKLDEILQQVIKKDFGLIVDKSAKGQDLFYRNIIHTAAQRLLEERTANIMVFRVNETDIAHSMNMFFSEGKEVIDIYRGAPKVGSLVIPRRLVDVWDKIYAKSVPATKVEPKGEDVLELYDTAKEVPKKFPADRVSRGTPEGEQHLLRERDIEKRLIDAGFGTPAQRILKIEDQDGVNMALLEDGTRVPVIELSNLPPQLSDLNSYDGFLRWGVQLAEDIGTPEATVLAKLIGDGRSTYCKMVAVSVDAAGNARMRPVATQMYMSQLLNNIDRSWESIRSTKAFDSAIWGGLTTAMRKVTTLWRLLTVYGFVPRPAHFAMNVVGDWAQMSLNPAIGFKDATKISLFGALGYLPGGDDYQRAWMKYAKSATQGSPRILMPPLLGSMLSPAIDDIFGANPNRIFKVKGGSTVSAFDLYNDGIRAGADSNLGKADMGDKLKETVNATVNATKGAFTARRKTAAEAYDIVRKSTYAVAESASFRTRMALYAHCRVNLGLSHKKSAEILHDSLYDWNFSISTAERLVIGAVSAFYPWFKNAVGEAHVRLFDGTDLAIEEYARQWMKMDTTQQKIMGLTRFSNQILGADQYVGPEEVPGIGPGYDIARGTRAPGYVPSWTHIGGPRTLGPEARAIGIAAGVDKTHWVIGLPKITGVEMTAFFAELNNIMMGAMLAALSSKHEFDFFKSFNAILEKVEDQLLPYSQNMVHNLIKEPKQTSPDGPTVRMDEFQFLNWVGYGDSMVPGKDRKQDVFRTDTKLIGLFRFISDDFVRLQLFWTVIAGDTPMTPTSIQMLEAEGYWPRLTALAVVSGVARPIFYNADVQHIYKLEDIVSDLKARSAKESQKSKSLLKSP